MAHVREKLLVVLQQELRVDRLEAEPPAECPPRQTPRRAAASTTPSRCTFGFSTLVPSAKATSASMRVIQVRSCRVAAPAPAPTSQTSSSQCRVAVDVGGTHRRSKHVEHPQRHFLRGRTCSAGCRGRSPPLESPRRKPETWRGAPRRLLLQLQPACAQRGRVRWIRRFRRARGCGCKCRTPPRRTNAVNEVPSSFSVTANVLPRWRSQDAASSNCTRVSSVFEQEAGEAPLHAAAHPQPARAAPTCGRRAISVRSAPSSCRGAGRQQRQREADTLRHLAPQLHRLDAEAGRRRVAPGRVDPLRLETARHAGTRTPARIRQ